MSEITIWGHRVVVDRPERFRTFGSCSPPLPPECEPHSLEIVAYLRDHKHVIVYPPEMVDFITHTMIYLDCEEWLMKHSVDDRILGRLAIVDRTAQSNIAVHKLFQPNGGRIITCPYTLDHTYSRLIPSGIPHGNRLMPQNENHAKRRVFTPGGRAWIRDICMDILQLFPNHLAFAGGSMQRMFFRNGVVAKNVDMDLFVIETKSDPGPTFEHLVSLIGERYGRRYPTQYFCSRTTCSVTFFVVRPTYVYPVIQLVLKRYSSLAALLDTFDICASGIAYYQSIFWTTSRCLLSIYRGGIIVDVNRQSTNYEHRLVKYYRNYHLDILIPSFSAQRVVYIRGKGQTGLAKLIDMLSHHIERAQIYYDYSDPEGVAFSRTMYQLHRRVNRGRKYILVMRRGNAQVFTPFTNDNLDTFPRYTDSKVSSSASFFPVDADWYAEAYGIAPTPRTIILPDIIQHRHTPYVLRQCIHRCSGGCRGDNCV